MSGNLAMKYQKKFK